MNIEKLLTDYKQYGFWGFQKRCLKFLLRKVGIAVDSYYYMVNEVDGVSNKMIFEKTDISDARILDYQDFLLGDKDVFTEKKLEVVKARLEKGSYIPYGIVRDSHLIYSCWISYKEMDTSTACLNGPLDDCEALLVDDYCSPSARGKGIHTAMNAYRLWQIAQSGKDKAVVIILRENKPAFKSQLKVGFKVAFTYYVATVWGKTYTNYFNKKSNNKGL